MKVGMAIGGVFLVLSGGCVAAVNEIASAKRAAGLESAAKECVSVEADKVDPAQDGKLIFLSGDAKTSDELSDDLFAVSESGSLRLRRNVEMYQWKESSRTTGKGKKRKTTTVYEQEWAAKRIDSSKFKNKTDPASGQGLGNPHPAIESATYNAAPIKVGARTLSQKLTEDLTAWERISMNESRAASLPGIIQVGDPVRAQRLDCPKCTERVKNVDRLGAHQRKRHRGTPIVVVGDGNVATARATALQTEKNVTRLFVGEDPKNPEIGDLRISFESVQPSAVSLVAQQKGQSFEPFRTDQDTEVLALRTGTRTQQQMFETLQSESAASMWTGRIIAMLMLLGGLGTASKGVFGSRNGTTEDECSLTESSAS